MPTWLISLGTALVTLLLILTVRRLFTWLNLLDKPHDYGLTRKPIPYSVGVIFVVIFAILNTFFVQTRGSLWTPQLISVLSAGIVITAVSFIDDRFRISPFFRLVTQVLVGIMVVVGGLKIQILSNPFGGAPFFLDGFSVTFLGQTIWILSAVLVIVWLILTMNVMNWLDGVPGLASGVSCITFVTLLILSVEQFHVVDQSLLIMLSAGLAASTFIFWLFDFYPPKLLMGDSGSMFLGFTIGVLSILAGGKMATALLVMGFPILDALIVIVRRVASGKSPFKGDYTHLHHRLMKSGLSERKTLVFIYIVCILCGAIALYLPTTLTKVVAFGCIATGMFFVQRRVTKKG